MSLLQLFGIGLYLLLFFGNQENVTLDYKGERLRPGVRKKASLTHMMINSVTTSTCTGAVDIMSEDNVAEALEANVNLS